MKILIASSELHPYSKTGGLADMSGALAAALAAAGMEVGVVTPLYRGIREKTPGLQHLDYGIHVPMADRWVSGGVESLRLGERLTIYFVDHAQYYDRPALYGEGWGYSDNAERFLFLSKSTVHLARYLWTPDVVHLHDWQTAIVPLLLMDARERAGWWTPPRTCLTIHNLAYQGQFDEGTFPLTNLPPHHYNPGGLEFFRSVNFLKAGIAYADLLTTVSPRYAREITTEAFGCSLDWLLRQRSNQLHGILNGVDYQEWQTENNRFLPAAYSASDQTGKAANKVALQKELGLPENPDLPMFGNVSRLVDQKGSDIMLGALEEMLAAPIQFVLLGSGDSFLERSFVGLAQRHPDKVAVKIGYDHGLSHRIEAGADFFLMPSRFEPCGLNQMYSLRYGTIPIVRATGGLDDSVVDPTEDEDRANGIKFHEFSTRALARAMRKALLIYSRREVLEYFRINGMTADFSWAKTARQYIDLYGALRR